MKFINNYSTEPSKPFSCGLLEIRTTSSSQHVIRYLGKYIEEVHKTGEKGEIYYA